MAREAEEKREEFLNKLALLGYDVEQVSKRPQIYRINGHLVNIRSSTRPRNELGDRCFWYDISLNVLRKVEFVIYLTTEPDYFVMFPSSFLASLVDRMYRRKDRESTRIFDIDWDALDIILQGGEWVNIEKFYCDLKDKNESPKFNGES